MLEFKKRLIKNNKKRLIRRQRLNMLVLKNRLVVKTMVPALGHHMTLENYYHRLKIKVKMLIMLANIMILMIEKIKKTCPKVG